MKTPPLDRTKAPLVSIGLPVFNGAKHLAQTLESLVQQTFVDFEVIVSDNASTDETPDICASYCGQDRRVVYHRQNSNVGATRNWNFLASLARGKYWKWAPANDYCAPNMLETYVGVLEARPEVVVAFGGTILVAESSALEEPYPHDFALLEDSPSIRLDRYLRDVRLNSPVTGLIRTASLRNTGLIRPYPSGDTILVSELALAGKFWLCKERLIYRRVGDSTTSSRLSAADLLAFLDPVQRHSRQPSIRPYFDLALASLRSSIAYTERGRAVGVCARRAYWAMCS